jgi:hypothetical protein
VRYVPGICNEEGNPTLSSQLCNTSLLNFINSTSANSFPWFRSHVLLRHYTHESTWKYFRGTKRHAAPGAPKCIIWWYNMTGDFSALSSVFCVL